MAEDSEEDRPDLKNGDIDIESLTTSYLRGVDAAPFCSRSRGRRRLDECLDELVLRRDDDGLLLELLVRGVERVLRGVLSSSVNTQSTRRGDGVGAGTPSTRRVSIRHRRDAPRSHPRRKGRLHQDAHPDAQGKIGSKTKSY